MVRSNLKNAVELRVDELVDFDFAFKVAPGCHRSRPAACKGRLSFRMLPVRPVGTAVVATYLYSLGDVGGEVSIRSL